ncbi:MAG: hypothetical protein JW981_11330 [Anaerolineae bacterium]|nr:hypothetical protein [Anaerolineae bacterium]
MFTGSYSPGMQVSGTVNRKSRDIESVKAALGLYHRAQWKGAFVQLWNRLANRSNNLLSLKEVESQCTITRRSYAGIKCVSLSQIKGSEGRSEDFDRDFHPIKSHNKQRWLQIAAARIMGIVLPPVELIQVGDVYFVRDGNHRVSVAAAMGREAIDAEVTVLQVKGTLPWEKVYPACKLAQQLA